MNNRKSIFFSADWHIQHANVITFDNRPFKDVTHMSEELIKRYNATVPEDGVCYFLGDMGNKPAEIKKVIDRLNGTKILILGNHDKGLDVMYNAGFDVVMHGAVLYFGQHRVTLSHCPLLDTPREDCSQMTKYKGMDPRDIPLWHGNQNPKHRMLSFKNEGQFHLSGHIHSRKDHPKSKKALGRQLDVGVCAWGFRPVSIHEVQSWVDLTLKEEEK